ncbi:hypothetical protein IWZ01DRAFT_70855 [Phyllosticta capitalensis]
MDSPQSLHPTHTMAKIEKLPTEIVSLIGDQLDPSSLAQLRLASKTMNDHLSFNTKRLFRELRCELALPKIEELLWLKRRPHADSVNSLIWIRPRGVIINSSPESELFPWNIHSDTHSAYKHFVGMWMSVAGFRNLRSIGWTSDEALQEWWIDTRGTGINRSDISFWVAFVKNIRRPLEIRFYERENVYWGFDWTGSKKSTTVAFVRTSLPVEMIYGADDNSLEGWQELRVCLRHMSQLGDKLHRNWLGSLELHRTIVECYCLEYFQSAQVKIWECRIYDPLDHHVFHLNNTPTQFLQTVRNLSIINCSLEAQERSTIVRFFAVLRDHGQLQSFQFERVWIQYGEHVGDLTFDWDNDGCPDDGARLRGVIDDMGMEMALTKAIDCVHVPGKPLAANMANRGSESSG